MGIMSLVIQSVLGEKLSVFGDFKQSLVEENWVVLKSGSEIKQYYQDR